MAATRTEAANSEAANTTETVTKAPKLVEGKERDDVVKSFHDGDLKPGYTLRWVTSGGETDAVVEKA